MIYTTIYVENPYNPIYIYIDDDSDILLVNPCRLGWLLHVGPAERPQRQATAFGRPRACSK